MLPLENEIRNKISPIILCAGEGSRLKHLTKTIPKPLLKIEALDNKTILENNINNILKLGIKQIAIVIGHLGYKIRDFISRLSEDNESLQDMLLIIDSENVYKLGPLYSFLSITKNKNFFNKKKNYLLIPGDTIFDFHILAEIMQVILKKNKIIQDYPLIFYRNIDVEKLNELYGDPKTISIVDIKTSSLNKLLVKISQIDIQKLHSSDCIKEVIPIFLLNYNIISIISKIKVPKKTVWEMLNVVIEKGNEIMAQEIGSDYNFYDIDNVKDLIVVNKKKKKDNRCSN